MWNESDDCLETELVFKDFVTAFQFMGIVAALAEEHEHHPEWSNVYNKVDVVLTTHDANGLTHLDVKLARKMDILAAK